MRAKKSVNSNQVKRLLPLLLSKPAGRPYLCDFYFIFEKIVSFFSLFCLSLDGCWLWLRTDRQNKRGHWCSTRLTVQIKESGKCWAWTVDVQGLVMMINLINEPWDRQNGQWPWLTLRKTHTHYLNCTMTEMINFCCCRTIECALVKHTCLRKYRPAGSRYRI